VDAVATKPPDKLEEHLSLRIFLTVPSEHGEVYEIRSFLLNRQQTQAPPPHSIESPHSATETLGLVASRPKTIAMPRAAEPTLIVGVNIYLD
jgi:hypothetical protein